MNAEQVWKLHERMESRRINWADHWEDVLQYVAPHKNRIYNDTRGEQRGQRIYNSTPQHFVELLASALHSMLTNPSVEWFGLTTGDLKTDQNIKVRKFLKQLSTKCHQLLSSSNFETEVHEFYLDLASLGTGATFIDDDDDDVFRFLTTQIFELVIQENAKGVVDTISRTVKMRPEQLIEKYGEESLGKHLQEIKNSKEEEIEVIHLITPREGRDTKKLDGKNKAFASYHVLKKHKFMLKEHGYNKNPWIIARWSKLSNEVYGRSPAMKTLPDIKMLNSMMKAVIRGAQKAIDPPMTVTHDSVIGRMNLASGGVTAMRQGQGEVKVIEGRGRVDIGEAVIERVTQTIKQGFFIDQLQLGGSDRMTEMEVSIRNDENLRLLSPILGRLHNEFLEPLIGRVIEKALKAKDFNIEIPAELDGMVPNIVYRSQIAKAQKSNESRSISAFVGEVANLSMSLQRPDILDVVDMDRAIKTKSELEGIDPIIFASEEDVEAARKNRAEQQQAQQQAAQRQADADAAKTEGEAQ